jgi:hypothetical protein
MHMYTFEICIWSILILGYADRCYFQNSIFGLSKYHLYIEIMIYLTLILTSETIRKKNVKNRYSLAILSLIFFTSGNFIKI